MRALARRFEGMRRSDGMWLLVGVAGVFAALIVGGALGNLLAP